MRILLLALAVLACAPVDPEIVARSELGVVRLGELDAFIAGLAEAERRPAAGESLRELRRRCLGSLLVRDALYAEALELGLAATPAGEERLAAVRRSLLLDLARRRRLDDRVKIGEQELRRYYDSHLKEFERGEALRLRHVFLRLDRDAPEAERRAVRAEIDGLLARLRSGANFADLARDRSDSETARLGGMIGRVARGQLDASLEKIVWELAPGEISSVVATPVGFHIFKHEGLLAASRTDFDEVRGEIRRRLSVERRAAVEAEVLEELLVEAAAGFFPERLDPSWQPPGAILLALAGDELTLDDFRQRWQRLSFVGQRRPPLDDQLRGLVLARLLIWDAERAGLAARPDAAARLEATEKGQLTQLAYERRADAYVAAREAELRQLVADDGGRFRTPRLHRLSLLTRDFGGGSQYRLYEELRVLAAAIRGGRARFADAARELSTDPSGPRGGDLGWVRLDDFLKWAGPEVGSAVESLAASELSEPLQYLRFEPTESRYRRQGYLLLRIEEIREPVLLAFDEVREQAVAAFHVRHQEEIRRAIDAEVLGSIGARIYQENL